MPTDILSNSMSSYGRKLDPYRRLRSQHGVKGKRTTIVVTHNPSTIDEKQTLITDFPNLEGDDVIVPGTLRLAFNITLESKDAERTVVANLGRALISKIEISLEGQTIYSLNNADVYLCYSDLWLTTTERENMAYQGICTENILAHRLGVKTPKDSRPDEAVADAYGKRFCIPLEFELLSSHMPFYQAGLRDRLRYELTFNEYSRVVRATGDPEASYKISGISLEYEMVTNPDLALAVRNQYRGRLAILYERVLCHKRTVWNKRDRIWNINMNVPTRSMRGILILFEDEMVDGKPFNRESEDFFNPKIKKVEVTIEGVPNQLYANGMRPYQQWDEARKGMAGGRCRDPAVANVIRDLALHHLDVKKFLNKKYALWLDFRSTDDDHLHGSGKRITEEMHLQLEKEAHTQNSNLKVYIYVVMDAQLNIEDGRLVEIIY